MSKQLWLWQDIHDPSRYVVFACGEDGLMNYHGGFRDDRGYSSITLITETILEDRQGFPSTIETEMIRACKPIRNRLSTTGAVS